MFIIELTYIQPLDDVERYFDEHITYLEQYYNSGHFLMSGRKNSRSGGVIIATSESLEEITAIYNADPFFTHNIAEYRITEFTPSKYTDKLKKLFQ